MKRFLCVLTITAIFLGTFGFSAFAESVFSDVPGGAYYEAPVQWAYENGITTGTSATLFSPDKTCVRAQVVTFLWRANGSPEPKSTNNPFKDVKSNQYYYKAVLWAVEKGITTGTSATTFSPDGACTRGQVVTFLWRAKAEPSASAANVFKDVKKGAYYYDAVLWAVENEITNGMSATSFAPEATCTRGQIVTFLYRDLHIVPEIHKHSYAKVVTKPTCTKEGYTTYTCACGHSYVGDKKAATGHTYVKYKCSECGAVDKAHAYEYLVEWVKENGEVDGAYVQISSWSGDRKYSLSYSANGNDIFVAESHFVQDLFVYNSLYLDTYFYGSSIGEIEVYGSLKAADFTNNSPITFDEYIGPTESKWDMVEFARLSMYDLLDYLGWVLEKGEVGITLADLGFYAY